MIAVFVIFGLIAAGLGIGLIATATAPVGYQDEIGFHFGQQKRTELAEFPCGAPQPQWI